MKALIAEDEEIQAENVEFGLLDEDFDGVKFDVVDKVNNGAAALVRLGQNEYDFVILDLKMPEVDGTRVIEELNQIEPPQKRPWVILTTAYPGAYESARTAIKMGVRALVSKPFELSDLMSEIRRLAKERRKLLEHDQFSQLLNCQWTLAFGERDTLFVHVRGLLNFACCCSSLLGRLDAQSLSKQAEIANQLAMSSSGASHTAKIQAKALGRQLYEKLFIDEVENSFVAAGASVLHKHDLKLCFTGSREILDLPLEFLNDGNDYLILRHPMRRFITGVRSKGESNAFHFPTGLQNNHEKIAILLVASNTTPVIAGVDEEVARLYEWMTQTLSSKEYVIDYLPSEKATHSEMIKRLTGCRYHIIHYAGHGTHNPRFPNQSSLYFRETAEENSPAKPLTVEAIRNVLHSRGHNLKFVYLSCCSGAAVADPSALLEDNLLGVADGLVLADVPAVLGFRWPVSDGGAKELAIKFYESLVEQGDLDTALFYARCKLAASEQGQLGSDWLSPILIVQR